jgi:hypothetical protein
VLRGKFVSINNYIKKSVRFQINKLMMYLKLLEKEQVKQKISRWKEIRNIREENNTMKSKRIIQIINKTKSEFV